MTAFADMVQVLFRNADLSVEAGYMMPTGDADGSGLLDANGKLLLGADDMVTVRVMVKAPDDLETFREAVIHSPTMIVDVRAADIPSPRPGDRLVVNGKSFTVQGEPVADRERLIWTLDCFEAA